MKTKRDNHSVGMAGLGIGTTTATMKTVNNSVIELAGRSLLKAATDNIAIAAMTKVPAVPLVNLAANQQCVVFVSQDASGNLAVEQSKIVPSSTGAGYVKTAFEWPAETPLYACIGAILITTNASGAFTFGTTALGATNTTAVFYNTAGDYGVPITN